MVDHEGHVKEIQWSFQQTGEHAGEIFPTIHDYLPENAPERLLPKSHPAPCAPAPCLASALAGSISTGSALEAALAMVLLGALLCWLYSLFVMPRRRAQDTPAAADDPAAPLILLDFPKFQTPDGPTCSISSSVTKAEAFMRFAGIPYSKQVGPDPAVSPKGQLPFLERGAQRIADAHFIIRHLVSSGAAPRSLLFPPSPHDRAVAVAVARMCDTDLAAAIVHYRWVDNQGFARCWRANMAPFRLMAPVAAIIARMVRKSSYTRTWEQGMSRHSESDRLAVVGEELAALSELLGDRPFLLGDSPHAVDATTFGVLDQMAVGSMNPQLAALVDQYPNLVIYRRRIKEKFFGPDYERDVVWVNSSRRQVAGGGTAAAGGVSAGRMGGNVGVAMPSGAEANNATPSVAASGRTRQRRAAGKDE